MNTKLFRIASVILLTQSGLCFAQGPLLSSSPTQSKNHVITTSPQVIGITSTSQLDGRSVSDVIQTIQYSDDLGRPVQTTNAMASPSYKDVIVSQEYDSYGRETRTYLPFTVGGNNGGFMPDALRDNNNAYNGSAHYQFYQNVDKVAHDQTPFSEAIFENSPLNRVLKQGAAGTAWKAEPLGVDDHSIEYTYLTNRPNEVMSFDYNPSTGRLVFNNLPYYEANQLFVKRAIDEHNAEVSEYTDKDGRVICKKVQYATDNGNTLYAETYYVYDDLGNLVVVLPPEAIKEIRALVSNP